MCPWVKIVAEISPRGKSKTSPAKSKMLKENCWIADLMSLSLKVVSRCLTSGSPTSREETHAQG